MPLWTSFAANAADEAKERAGAEHDAERARIRSRTAYEEELAGLLARLAVNERDIQRVDAELEGAAPHWRTKFEAERDRLLRHNDYLEGRAELVRIEMRRFQ